MHEVSWIVFSLASHSELFQDQPSISSRLSQKLLHYYVRCAGSELDRFAILPHFCSNVSTLDQASLLNVNIQTDCQWGSSCIDWLMSIVKNISEQFFVFSSSETNDNDKIWLLVEQPKVAIEKTKLGYWQRYIFTGLA